MDALAAFRPKESLQFADDRDSDQLLIFTHHHKQGLQKYILLDRTLSANARCATGFDLGPVYQDTPVDGGLQVNSVNKLVQSVGFSKGNWKQHALAFHSGASKWSNIYKTPELSAYVDNFSKQFAQPQVTAPQPSVGATSISAEAQTGQWDIIQISHEELKAKRQEAKLNPLEGGASGGHGDVVKLKVGARTLAVKYFQHFSVLGGWLDDTARRTVHQNLFATLQLQHPNLLPLRGLVYANGEVVALAFELYPSTLHHWTATGMGQETKGWRECCSVMCDAADGCAHLHALGRLHRDVKPANILVSD